jgi:hypothetical protein
MGLMHRIYARANRLITLGATGRAKLTNYAPRPSGQPIRILDQPPNAFGARSRQSLRSRLGWRRVGAN